MAYIDDAKLREVFMALETEFCLDQPFGDFDEVERIDSRTAVIYVVSGEGFEPAVLKAGKDWTPKIAQRVYEDLTDLARLFEESDLVGVQVPRPLGWHESPPSVCMVFVGGEDLSQLLSRREGYMSSEVERAMADTGAALGLYHTAEVAAAAGHKHLYDMAEIVETISAMAKKVAIRLPSLPADLEDVIARRYGDFAPYNIRVAEDGSVWLLDQPSEPTYAPIHHDVSYFLGRVEGRLGRHESARRRSLRAVQSGLETTFMEAYAKTGPRPLQTDEDQALIATYRAHRSLMTARKRLSQGRLTESPRYLGSALHWRRHAKSLS